MARDSSLYLRKAVVAALKADAGVSAIVAARSYGPNPPAEPTWPFNRYGFPVTTPLRATCMDGARISFIVHGFAKGDDETGCSELGAANARALDRKTLTLGGGYPAKALVRWTGNQIIRDSDEATGWHCIGSFEARVVS